jgi:hypothetical protein
VVTPNVRQLEPDDELAEETGRAQACRLTRLRCLPLPLRSLWRLPNDTLRVLVFVLADRRCDSVNIGVVGLALAAPVLLNDGGHGAFMFNSLMAGPRACR